MVVSSADRPHARFACRQAIAFALAFRKMTLDRGFSPIAALSISDANADQAIALVQSFATVCLEKIGKPPDY